MRILGIDPGSIATGYGVVEREGSRVVHVAHGTLRPPRASPLAQRLSALLLGLTEVLEAHRPEVAVVERIFAGANARSALVLGHARGVALAAVAGAGIPVREYASPEIKRAVVGTGAAEKRQVQAMVCRLLRLERAPGSDAADALAAAICHAHAGPLAGLVLPRRARSRPADSRLVVRRSR
jgi:crossover junction endodeoxyribonuclease RuvC